MTDLAQAALGITSRWVVGFVLGLAGGGGLILAVPLMVYVVGVRDPHVAIDTSALAVAANAACNILTHARVHTVKWRCAAIYAASVVIGAVAGSTLGKRIDGGHLISAFALIMFVVGATMLQGRHASGGAEAQCDRTNAPKVVSYGLDTGVVSGFFGIGGGFLIVPGLMASTGMPILNAIGSSLVGVTAFGVTTAANYALSGWIDWLLAAMLVIGGAFGGTLDVRTAASLSGRTGVLRTLFAGLIFVVAAYVFWRSVTR